MSALVLALFKAAIILPIWAFIAYQNRNHKRSIWDLEQTAPNQGAGQELKD
jgi:hypothetical protein